MFLFVGSVKLYNIYIHIFTMKKIRSKRLYKKSTFSKKRILANNYWHFRPNLKKTSKAVANVMNSN